MKTDSKKTESALGVRSSAVVMPFGGDWAADELRQLYRFRDFATISLENGFKLGRLMRCAPVPMTSRKNLSPHRLIDRRRRKKAARKARRHNDSAHQRKGEE